MNSKYNVNEKWSPLQKRIKQAQKYLEWNKPDQAIAELKPTLNSDRIQKEFRWVPNHLMGVALSLQGESESAVTYLERAIKYGADQAETYHMLSERCYDLGRLEDAERYGREAVERKPGLLKAWLNLGAIFQSKAKLNEALKCYKQANQLDPQNAGVAFQIGRIYRNQGDLEKAMELFDIALQVDENHIKAMLEKADIRKKNGHLDEALEDLREARDIHGDHPAIKISEAEVFKSRGNYDKAIDLYESILEEYPENGLLRVNYALCLQEVGRFEECEKNYRQAIEQSDDPRLAISNYLMSLHYNPQNDRKYIYEEHVKFGREFTPEREISRAEPSNLDPQKKLKVGFVSGGFRRHPVGWMIAGALEQLPDEQFELFCYTTDDRVDFITRRIHRNINHWQTVKGYSDKVIEKMIREDGLDILVDLSGHAAENRLNVMAHKPAPVLVKWVGGLFNTTGLEAFDYLITDDYESPEGEEPYYTEKLVRMPDDYVSYTPPAYAPEIGALPVRENGYITFGCFNNPTKVNEQVLKHWASIMQQVPKSRLYLKSKQYDTASFRQQILEVMQREGVSGARIEFNGHTGHTDHLAAYNEVDIALDPWPYSGGLTTCEALYMGVPVITLPGPTFAGRHSTTHLINAGLDQWVADDWEEYVEKTVELAKNRQALEKWRNGLRKQLRNSPVCNGKRFGAHLSVVFRRMWEQRVEGYKNDNKKWQDHIDVDPLSAEKIEELTDGPDSTPLITVKDPQKRDKDLSAENSKSQMMKEKTLNKKSVEETVSETEELVQDIEQREEDKYTDAKNDATCKNEPRKNGKDRSPYFVETQGGISICAPSDLDVLTTYVLHEQGQWFEPELDFLRRYVEPGMQVVDVGACFGAYALPLAQKVGSVGRVFAFEPSADSRKYLEQSKMENELDQLEIISRGITDGYGKASMKHAPSPELHTVSQEGIEEINLSKFDAWWCYTGQPEVDVIKIDVNGMEADVLAGASWLLEGTEPVLVIAIGENEAEFIRVRELLAERDYRLYEYIPGPGVLAEHEPEAGVDPYMMNIVAVPRSRVEEFKEEGWIFDASVEREPTDPNSWKQLLENQPWAKSKIDPWAEKVKEGNDDEYIEALNLACAAEQIEISADEPASRSRKGVMMLTAAQKLTQLFNSGDAGIPAGLTYVRIMSQLGKTMQAVEMAKQLMETVNGGDNLSVDLPFLAPLPEQDTTAVETKFSNWLTVRVVEAWVTLQDPTTYMAGGQEQQMLQALEGNPEVMPKTNHIVSNLINRDHRAKSFDEGSKPSGTFVHVCFNHVYAKSLADLIKYTNENSDQEHWLFVEKHKAIPTYSADISDNPQATFFDKQTQLNEVLNECLKPKVDGIFVHGLFFDWQKKIINEIGDQKHIAWKYWGGDLYNPIKQGRPLHDIISKVDSVHGKVEGDFEIIKETYGQKQEYKFGYAFPGLYGNWPEEIEKETPPIITVGNSGDPSNNHIDILKLLAEKKDIEDYQLHLPVAYNFSRPYRDKLIRSIKDLGLSDITRLQESFIPPKEYMQMIMKGSMLIVAHNRQQALGNILASIYSGNNTFVKKEVSLEGKEIVNPTWRFIEDYNLKAQPFEDLHNVDNLSEIPPISKNMRKKHQELIKSQVGLAARSQPFVEACDEIAKYKVKAL